MARNGHGRNDSGFRFLAFHLSMDSWLGWGKGERKGKGERGGVSQKLYGWLRAGKVHSWWQHYSLPRRSAFWDSIMSVSFFMGHGHGHCIGHGFACQGQWVMVKAKVRQWAGEG